jgi:uncharacterized protein YndB with AHSA1/START domain
MSHPVTVTTPSDREVTVVRVVDAPRHLVFEAMNRPEHLRRWLLGPPGWSMPVCEVDFRVGGEYRYVWQNDESGKRFGSTGTFLEIEPPERVVATELFDGGIMGPEAVNTTTLTESGGRTTITMLMRYATKEVRDAALATGMTKGIAASFDLLDTLLASLR